MKKINYILCITLALLVSSCEKDDFTGESKLTPTSPTISVTGVSGTVTLVEQEKTYTYNVSLSEPQVVDIAVYISQSGGTATEGEDFVINNGNSRVFIPAGRTTGTVSISIKADVIQEETETLTLQIGDDRTGNSSITPVSVQFSILNVTEGDLALGLSWNATDTVFDATGHAVAPAAVADLIFWLTDEEGSIFDEADGSGFESLVLSSSAPDGIYYAKVGIYDAIDLGSLGDPRVLDLGLTYSQTGVINEMHEDFPNAFNTAFNCSGNIYTMVKIVKSGETYSVTRQPSTTLAPIPEGTYVATLDPAMADYWFGVTSAVRDVTVTQLTDNTWSISDITAGAYNACCGLPINQAAVIKLDYCSGQISILSETGAEITGQGKAFGSFNSLTGTFTVHFNDRFGSASDPDADLNTTFVLKP